MKIIWYTIKEKTDYLKYRFHTSIIDFMCNFYAISFSQYFLLFLSTITWFAACVGFPYDGSDEAMYRAMSAVIYLFLYFLVGIIASIVYYFSSDPD